MDKEQLRDLITTILKGVDLYSESAVELLMLTAATESKLGYYIRQVGGGPALGIFQMEKRTELDIFDNYLVYRNWLVQIITPYCSMASDSLEYNLGYQIIMARIHYLRVKEPLPNAGDIAGLANYWKKHYNTEKGSGTVRKAIGAYQEYAI